MFILLWFLNSEMLINYIAVKVLASDRKEQTEISGKIPESILVSIIISDFSPPFECQDSVAVGIAAAVPAVMRWLAVVVFCRSNNSNSSNNKAHSFVR